MVGTDAPIGRAAATWETAGLPIAMVDGGGAFRRHSRARGTSHRSLTQQVSAGSISEEGAAGQPGNDAWPSQHEVGAG